MMTNYIKILFILFFSPLVYGQTKGEKLFQELTDYYDNTSRYQMILAYELYHTNEKGQQVLTEAQEIKFYKDDKITRLDAVGANMYTYDDFVISVFEDGKEIVVRNNVNDSNIINDLQGFSKHYNIDIEKEKGEEVQLRLIPKEAFVETVAYKRIKIVANQKTKKIKNQELYLKQQIPFQSENGMMLKSPGVLKVIFNYSENIKIELPKSSDHFLRLKGNQLSLSEAFSSYMLTDARITKN